MDGSAGANQKRSFLQRIAPAIALMVLAPLIAEVLPGATRFGAIFVFPIEMLVWGGGAVMIRELVRRNDLGWANLLLLALCLAIAEEWLIQQTSIAPLVIALKGQEWARAGGVNYAYFLWAAVYEAVLVVFVPVMLAEMLFPARRRDRWLSKAGWAVQALLFLIGSFFAWFSWTQIARTKVFHLPEYNPPLTHILIAVGSIALLLFVALGPWRARLARPAMPLTPPAPWLLALGGAVWSVLWFGLELLAFGIAPQVPPALAIGPALALCAAMVTTLLRYAQHPDWSERHRAWLIAGTMIATMAVFFFAFQGADPKDLWFKIATNAVAALWFVWLVVRVSPAASQHRS